MTRSQDDARALAVLFKRESRGAGYYYVTAPAFPGWSYMLSPVCPKAHETEMHLSFIAFLEAEFAALRAPQPSEAVREALKDMLFYFDKPQRDEWLSQVAWEEAKQVCINAHAALSVPAVTTGEPVVACDDVLSVLYTYRDHEPEEDESWESWYYAAFDLACIKIRELFGRAAVSYPPDRAALLPAKSAGPIQYSEAQLKIGVQYIDWDVNLDTETEVRQLGEAISRMGGPSFDLDLQRSLSSAFMREPAVKAAGDDQ